MVGDSKLGEPRNAAGRATRWAALEGGRETQRAAEAKKRRVAGQKVTAMRHLAPTRVLRKARERCPRVVVALSEEAEPLLG